MRMIHWWSNIAVFLKHRSRSSRTERPLTGLVDLATDGIWSLAARPTLWHSSDNLGPSKSAFVIGGFNMFRHVLFSAYSFGRIIHDDLNMEHTFMEVPSRMWNLFKFWMALPFWPLHPLAASGVGWRNCWSRGWTSWESGWVFSWHRPLLQFLDWWTPRVLQKETRKLSKPSWHVYIKNIIYIYIILYYIYIM